MKIDINENEIIKESSEIVDFKILKKITNSGIEKCVCKIINKNELTIKRSSGFLLNIPSKKRIIKTFITNNHVIDQNYLDNENYLLLSIVDDINEDIRKEIKLNLKKPRIKYTNEKIDFTVIEILPEDTISNFLDIDDDLSNAYKEKKQIFITQYPEGGELKYSHGKIVGKKENRFYYDAGTLGGSSGSPILSLDNLRVIGLHMGKWDKNDKINIGIPINTVIEEIKPTKYKLFISNTTNKRLLLEVDESETIDNLKKQIQEKFNLDSDNIWLSSGGIILYNEYKTIGDFIDDFDLYNEMFIRIIFTSPIRAG